ESQKFTLAGVKEFKSISSLVKYYSQYSVPNAEGITKIKFRVPFDGRQTKELLEEYYNIAERVQEKHQQRDNAAESSPDIVRGSIFHQKCDKGVAKKAVKETGEQGDVSDETLFEITSNRHSANARVGHNMEESDKSETGFSKYDILSSQ